MIKDDNHQNCPVNELSVSPQDFMFTCITSIVISKWEHKMDWNNSFNRTKCVKATLGSLIPVIVMMCSNSFMPKEAPPTEKS